MSSDTSHHARGDIPLEGVTGTLGENWGGVCRQDSQTLNLGYSFMAKNISLNIQILPKTLLINCLQFRANTYTF